MDIFGIFRTHGAKTIEKEIVNQRDAPNLALTLRMVMEICGIFLDPWKVERKSLKELNLKAARVFTFQDYHTQSLQPCLMSSNWNNVLMTLLLPGSGRPPSFFGIAKYFSANAVGFSPGAGWKARV